MKRLLNIILCTGFLLAITVNTGLAEDELNNGCFTLRDSSGRMITQTAHQMVVGDEYLNSDNHLYRVVQVQGRTAIVMLIRENALQASVLDQCRSFLAGVFSGDLWRAEVRQKGPIGIYHTHSDESYIPGDGTASKPAHGGIFQVGDSLTRAFENEGIPVIHDKTPHDPHDAMAYDRSRRTAVKLLRNQPTTLLDVHRDAVPEQVYADTIGNKGVTKVQLVVGRQNPNFEANNTFAKQIKQIVDKKYPGFIKGIFYGNGKYNQDLGPRSMLLEFGSHTNSKISAERGAGIFAAAAREALYGPGRTNTRVSRGSSRSLFWILLALIGGVGLFLLINRSSLKNLGREFTGAMGETEAEKPAVDSPKPGSDRPNHSEDHQPPEGNPGG